MGTYLNPENAGFEQIVNSRYVDKTGLIGLVNRSINTTERLMCMSRPRRFGKSFAALMLAAYYSRGCDSRALFENLDIARDSTFERYLNRYHVILIDVAGFVADAKVNRRPLDVVPSSIERAILSETQGLYPETRGCTCLTDCLTQLVQVTGTPIIFIIDEWDSPIREAAGDTAAHTNYLHLLRGWFENDTFTPHVVAAAFITGILPIKKDGSRSSLPDFREQSMLDPMDFARYTGFTEDEVRHLCLASDMSFSKIGQWYDGYSVGGLRHVYNPYTVMRTLHSGTCKPYWTRTSAPDTLRTFIDLGLEGLADDARRLMAGERVMIDTDSFQNDLSTFTRKDDVLTLLVHLGYLTFEQVTEGCGDVPCGVVCTPNHEIHTEFVKTLRKTSVTGGQGSHQRDARSETPSFACYNGAKALPQTRWLVYREGSPHMLDLQPALDDIRAFRDQRDWRQFHNPKDLAISISLEASELLEAFQWSGADTSATGREGKIREELADVLIYCLLLADTTGLDPIEIVEDKIAVNRQKYPVETSRGSARKYTEL